MLTRTENATETKPKHRTPPSTERFQKKLRKNREKARREYPLPALPMLYLGGIGTAKANVKFMDDPRTELCHLFNDTHAQMLHKHGIAGNWFMRAIPLPLLEAEQACCVLVDRKREALPKVTYTGSLDECKAYREEWQVDDCGRDCLIVNANGVLGGAA